MRRSISAAVGLAVASATLWAASTTARDDFYVSLNQTIIDGMIYHAGVTVGTASICAAYGGCDEAEARMDASRARLDGAGATHADTTYAASPAVSRRVVEQVARELRARDPAGAANFLAVANGRDLVAAWDDMVREDGLASGDVADAMAGYWAVLWMLVNGVKPGSPDEISSAQAKGLRDQIKRALAASPEIAAADDATRQELAETAILNALLLGGAMTDLSAPARDAEYRRLSDEYRGHARRLFGLDFRALDLTEDGLRPHS